MKPLKLLVIILLIIIFIINIYYSNRYDLFIVDDNTLLSLDNKIKNIKNEYTKKQKLITNYNKLFNNDLFYDDNIKYLDNRYHIILKQLYKEIEQIKNLNRIYYQKIKDLEDINTLYILKKDYLLKLVKIQHYGYDNILKLEKYNTSLYDCINTNQLYSKDMYNEKLYIDDIKNINNDYSENIDFLKNILKSKLKKDKVKNSKCQLNIVWFDDIENRIKCCKFEKNKNKNI